ncbi:Phospholipase C/P1 nuclease, core [Metarhizium album ARSEF 1941]|uniref:Phospholipase C/P1 nuclease, core n=1 Tax=Metarhizium album (strain ARSEF 1941) TaxID=1081103 RepID=A0A0B2X5L1_METAS|nr:Phospholipase C/P1 nuclease, core [Metarhizium album ARSEF 1941]KHO01053.1 Phospholipase C/P1 nuclease, core [Metarhizium album ARSEF 1941]
MCKLVSVLGLSATRAAYSVCLPSPTLPALSVLGNGIMIHANAHQADDYRATAVGKWSPPPHFVHAGSCSVDYNRDCSTTGCYISTLTTQRAGDKNLSNDDVAQALKSLAHFTGCLNQPLRVEAYQVCGNKINVTFDKHRDNLHSDWDLDTYVPEKPVGGGALPDVQHWADALCDRVPTGCSQCKRKGIECSGYRDPRALRVRDETSRTARKFEKKAPSYCEVLMHAPEKEESGSKGAVADQDSAWPCSRSGQLINSLLGDVRYPLQQDLQHTSMAYFLACYIYATPFQRYVPSFCLDGADPEGACPMTISATALAAYSRHVRSAQYLGYARQKYAGALTRVNESLSSPATAVLDRTLVSVLVLGLFEAIVFEAGKSPTSWTAHTLGAWQLIRLRGPQQVKSSLSRKILAHAINNVKTSCIQRSIPVPADLVAFDRQLALFRDADDASVRLSPIVQQIASVKARAMADPDCNLVHEALVLDQELAAFSEDCPAWMSYTVGPGSDSDAPGRVYEGVCHRYPSAYVAKLWNTIRLLRMLLVSLIGEIAAGQFDANLSRLRLPPVKPDLADYLRELEQYARGNMTTIATEVLASIPSFVEVDGFGRRFAPAGRSLAWPLSIIEGDSSCGEAAREHAYRNLEMLAGDLNMPQAVHPSRTSSMGEDW